MTIIIKKNIGAGNFKKSHCLQTLLPEGYCIVDTEDLKFRELSKLSTHTGRNRLQLFTCRLKGQITIDRANNSLIWELSFAETLYKTILAIMVCTLSWQYMVESIWTNSMAIGSLAGSLILLTDLTCMSARVNKLTEQMQKSSLAQS